MSIGRNILSDVIPTDGSSEYWRTLFYYNVYRFCIAIFLITASLSPLQVGSLGSSNSGLFSTVSLGYAPLVLISGIFIYKSRPLYITICRVIIATDIFFITLLIYASEGLGSGLELLLVITVAASGILMGGRSAMATAAFATLFLFGEHLFVILNHERRLGGFTAMGFMGLGLFITAFIIHYLAARLRVSEDELVRHQVNIQNLNQLNRYIINWLPSGVLVIDRNGHIWLDNQRARDLLGVNEGRSRQHLSVYAPALVDATNRWLEDNTMSEQKIVMDRESTLLAHFQPIETFHPDKAFIILIDDLSKVEKERQNDKLIAMGHLTSSIAHEIRNPLGAISHAGQLLVESEHLHDQDGRLVEIINTQSRRVNRIIQSTLELGRPSYANRTELNLYEWLAELTDEYRRENGETNVGIELSGDRSLSACFDPEQMRQVIYNLLQNAALHADAGEHGLASLVVRTDKAGIPQLQVHDTGPGIPEPIRERIFEPFFTTSTKGSGLGLYIARQICTSNGGSLEYVDNDKGGHFKVTFSPALQAAHATVMARS